MKDLNVRDWEDVTYMEDFGALQWHSITISKYPDGGQTHILIVKDNWVWIIETLGVLFMAVMVVLIVLFLVMKISGKIISSLVEKAEAKKADATA